MGDLKKVGRVGAKALLYFEIVTTFALIIGVIVALVIKPGHGIITNNIKGRYFKIHSNEFQLVEISKGEFNAAGPYSRYSFWYWFKLSQV